MLIAGNHHLLADIKGVTISTYLRFGERFIAEIKKHVES